MSDKPKPGKDKDLRSIRQAMEATQRLFGLLAELGMAADIEQTAPILAEALLLTADQLDDLDQLLANPAGVPRAVIEQNRELRRLVRILLHHHRSNGAISVMRMAEAAGSQLTALLVVQNIRDAALCNRPLSTLSSNQHRRQGNNVLDQ